MSLRLSVDAEAELVKGDGGSAGMDILVLIRLYVTKERM
jgi:hypothetical protein